MKATGIVRRVDDLGRVVIPKEVRRALHIHEGEALEIFTEGNAVCFKKYEVGEEEFAQKCADWVQGNKNYILAANFMNGTTTVMFEYAGKAKIFSVRHNPKDKFDMNVAICYAAKKCGFRMFDGFED